MKKERSEFAIYDTPFAAFTRIGQNKKKLWSHHDSNVDLSMIDD